MSKKRRCEVEASTAKRVHSKPDKLWRIMMDYPDIFDNFILPKLSCNDVKFFYDVNSESRMAIKRSSERLCTSFKIRDFFTKSTLSWALKNCSENKKRFCEQMAFNGNIELLQYLHKRGCPWNEWACKAAAQNGHLECLKYLHEKGCPWDEYSCSNAARNGHLECLKYLLEKRCPKNVYTCSYAASGGHLECLKYLHEKRCPWDKWTCKVAAENGHLECLKYLHEKGCPWDARTYSWAAGYVPKYHSNLKGKLLAIYNDPIGPAGGDSGIELSEMCKLLGEKYTMDQVRVVVEYLCNEGHVYSTITDDHHRSTRI